MGSNPINLALRFLLELTTLIAAGIWGWNIGEGITPYLFAFTIPILLAAAWGTFNVPNDPSRSGKAPIKTPGIIRLILELSFFTFGTWCLFDLQYTNISILFSTIVIGHYAVSYDRIKWLVLQ